MQNPAPTQLQYDSLFLPDFCNIRAVFAVVVVGELLAFVLTLASLSRATFWYDLSLTSLFVQWIALLSAAALCVTRRMLVRLGNSQAAAVSYGLLLAVTLAASAIAYWIMRHAGDALAVSRVSQVEFVLRNVAMSAIINAVVLRYLYVQHQWKMHIQSESRARIEALQARIRPHFLFNSMNVIASLTRSQPERAEQAVEDLADLFRASLAGADHQVQLDEEIEIAQRYLHIEQLRLGDRLKVEWDLDDVPGDALVPPLVLQPLLENAIYHGIEPCQNGGTIQIIGRIAGKRLAILIRNPLPGAADPSDHIGNRMALSNIQQRLQVFYERPGKLIAGVVDNNYQVKIDIPCVR